VVEEREEGGHHQVGRGERPAHHLDHFDERLRAVEAAPFANVSRTGGDSGRQAALS
jgi:hypothetical protein